MNSMDDFIDIVVPLAMLAISLATAVIGAKRKKAQKPVESTPVFNMGNEGEEHECVPLSSVAPVVEEGISTIPDTKAPAHEVFVQAEDKVPPAMSAEEKKKLIIYSEILKPKFDA